MLIVYFLQGNYTHAFTFTVYLVHCSQNTLNLKCLLILSLLIFISSMRHGRQHTIMPTNVNYQANIWALKEEGCTHLLVTTACGSLREDIQPGDIVLIDQFIDRLV